MSSFDLLHASLSPKYNRNMIFKSGKGAGKSGSFFFYSHDRQFIIKTMTKGELELVLKLLPNLSEHFINNPTSLLAKIFGVFTIETFRVDKVYVLLMENTLQLHDVEQLRNIFDLKGSTVNRLVTGCTKPSDTLKDINFLKIKKRNPNLTKMSSQTSLKLATIMSKDVRFLRQNNLMDYSLLLGIEKKSSNQRKSNQICNDISYSVAKNSLGSNH